jgi:putative transposase
VTTNPTAAWTTQQARNFSMHCQETGQKVTLFLRNRDSKFTEGIDRVIEDEGAEVKPVGPLAPNMNAHAERFVQTIKGECLDHFTFFGERHLQFVLKSRLEHYHTERPHQGVGNVPLGETPQDSAGPESATLPFRLEDMVCEERLGGLIRHYRRAA